MSESPSGYAVLHITGEDASDFLRAQLTTDVQRLDQQEHGFSAWCDAKGRALVIFRVVVTETGFLLTLPAPLVEATIRRLRMYVLRAKVEITDVSSDWALSGLTAATSARIPDNGVVIQEDDSYLLGMGAGHDRGALHIQPAAQAGDTRPIEGNDWQLFEIDAGLPEVTTATSAAFVPQMLNLHWLDGIDFDKGCYPGQEVVARLQYRGRLTRRMFRMQWQGVQPAPGDEIANDNGKQQGTVIRAAHTATGEGRLLAVVRVEAAAQALTTEQARLSLLELPYPTNEQAAADA